MEIIEEEIAALIGYIFDEVNYMLVGEASPKDVISKADDLIDYCRNRGLDGNDSYDLYNIEPVDSTEMMGINAHLVNHKITRLQTELLNCVHHAAKNQYESLMNSAQTIANICYED